MCFSGRLEKQDGRPCLWLVETFSTSPLKLLNGIQWNMTGSKIITTSGKFVFFGPIGKTRWPYWRLIGRDIFNFSSETAEQNSTKLDRKQDYNVLYQVCVFWADRKNKMAALGLWLAETFSTSPLKPLNGIQRNLTESKISMFLYTKFVFSGHTKMAVLVFLSKRWHIVLRCTICGPFGLLFMYLFRWRKGQWGVALMHLYVWEHIVIPNYRTAWRMFTKLGRDEELVAPHMHWGVLARSTQGRIQGRAKIGNGGLLLPETSSSDRKATATNGMYNNDLEACGRKCRYFLFHSEVKFFMHSSFSCERQWPFGPLVK